MFRDMVC